MRGAVLQTIGAPLEILSGIEVPDPGLGQVQVRLAYSGVCHSQLMEVRGGRGDDPWLPHLLGHEGTGVVTDVGEGVSKVVVGQRVVLGWIRGAGYDIPGTRYRHGSGEINAGAVTTFNEEAVVSENRCVPLPDGVPLDVGVLLGCALPTGAGMVINELQPEEGTAVALFGLGGIGACALLACATRGLKETVVVEVDDAKLALAADLGATRVVDARETDPVDEIREMTDGKGVDYAIESAGRVDTIRQAFESVRDDGGWCLFASHPPSGERIALNPHDLIRGKRITGSWGGASDPDRDVPAFASLYLEGRLSLDRLLGRWYPLESINEALDDLEHRQVHRPLIELDSTVG
jgi:S-(hydroxymethyl)glutathione dehydrogenase/alcohol dehydrogenase